MTTWNQIQYPRYAAPVWVAPIDLEQAWQQQTNQFPIQLPEVRYTFPSVFVAIEPGDFVVIPPPTLPEWLQPISQPVLPMEYRYMLPSIFVEIEPDDFVITSLGQPVVIPGGRFFGTKTVTTAGTAESLASSGTRVRAMSVVAKMTNIGQVYLGGSDVASTTNDGLDAGEFVSVRPGGWFDLSELYIDVDTDGEGVDLWGVDD